MVGGGDYCASGVSEVEGNRRATCGRPALISSRDRNLIYKDECLFVCMYGTYTNSHF